VLFPKNPEKENNERRTRAISLKTGRLADDKALAKFA
jgi:hypothetical protein